MTNDYDGAVDLAQETFLRVYRAAGRYQTTHAFSTYIYRIATNLAISELRKRKRRRLVSLTGLLSSDDGQEARDFDAPDDRPLQDVSLVDSEKRAVVKRAISTLPDKYRAPLVLRDMEGKSYDEIASILCTSEGTVKSRINRARNFLRDKMRNYIQVVAIMNGKECRATRREIDESELNQKLSDQAGRISPNARRVATFARNEPVCASWSVALSRWPRPETLNCACGRAWPMSGKTTLDNRLFFVSQSAPRQSPPPHW